MKKGDEEASWVTSFWDVTIRTTPRTMVRLAKRLNSEYYDGNDGEGKVNFEFHFRTSDNFPFTVYDWNSERVLGMDEVVDFHIGAYDKVTSLQAKDELEIEFLTKIWSQE